MAVAKIIGLDIGSHSVKMVEFDRSKKGLTVGYVGLAPLPDGAIVEKTIKKADHVSNAINALIRNAKTRTKSAATSLSGKAVIIKNVSINSMTDQQLEKQIQVEAEPYIPFDIKDVYLDFCIMGNKPEREGTMQVVLVAAKQDYMNNYTDLLRSCGLVPVVVDVDPFALEVMYEYCYPNVSEEVIALVNVGASTTNVNIVKSGASDYTRDLPIGGDLVTREIMRFFDVDYIRAENIKRGAYVDNVSPRNLYKIFHRSADQFTEELRKILDYYSTNVSYDPIQKIFLSGGAARSYALASTIGTELSLPVEIVEPFVSLKADEKLFDLSYLQDIGPTMAVAVGLALRDERDKQV